MHGDHASGVIRGIADGFRTQRRSPILRTPAEEGLAFEDVTFASEDGIPLEGWLIPCPNSGRLVIVNHPRGFNRSGFPSHLEPWKSAFAAGGNDFEVNFIPDLKLLNQAGYNVLTYDLRNHGHSAAGNGGLITSGRFESRDVIGSLAYARDRADLRGMTIALFSRCMGCNATMFAVARRPDLFADVRCLVGVQPVSARAIMTRMLALAGVGTERIDELGEAIRRVTSIALDDLSPLESAKSVRMPTMLYQVRDDALTHPGDVQAIFDNIASAEKVLFWIEGTTRRWDGYTYFARHPERIIDWLARHTIDHSRTSGA